MVAVSQRDDVEVARVRPSHQHGQIVRLGAAVDEIDDLWGVAAISHHYPNGRFDIIALTHFELPRQLGGERRRVLVQLGVHINICRVPQPLHLLDRRRVHLPEIGLGIRLSVYILVCFPINISKTKIYVVL